MQPKKRITLRELTTLTGLSRTTIYNVLNNKGNFSPETKITVLKAMEEYHYRPNLNARNLALRREHVIAYVGIHSKKSPYYNRAIQLGLARAIQASEDDGLCLINKIFDVNNEAIFQSTVLELEASGIHSFVLFARNDRDMCRFAQKLIDRNNVVVLLSNHLAVQGELAYVGCDYFRAGVIGAQVLEKMCPNPARVQVFMHHVEESDSSTTQRYRGFLVGMEHSTKDISILEPIYLDDEVEQKDSIAALLKARNANAVIDIIGNLPLLCAELQLMGASQTISLVGFDLYDELVDSLKNDTIDALINQSLSQQAELAVQLLFQYLCYNQLPEKKENFASLDIVMSSNLTYYLEQG